MKCRAFYLNSEWSKRSVKCKLPPLSIRNRSGLKKSFLTNTYLRRIEKLLFNVLRIKAGGG